MTEMTALNYLNGKRGNPLMFFNIKVFLFKISIFFFFNEVSSAQTQSTRSCNTLILKMRKHFSNSILTISEVSHLCSQRNFKFFGEITYYIRM